MSLIDDLKGYKDLLDQGVITEEEFQTKKQEILSKQEFNNRDSDFKGATDFIQSVREVPNSTGVMSSRSRIAAGVLAIFLGSLGVHNFYLGYKNKGILQLALTIISFVLCIIGIGVFTGFAVYVWTFIEGILILTSANGSRWHLDADGNELRD